MPIELRKRVRFASNEKKIADKLNNEITMQK